MENLQDYENKKYVAAEQVEYKFQDLLIIYGRFVLSMMKSGIRIFFHILKLMFELVVPPKPKSIAGQLALVTGGANGLGREIARYLAREKCNVVICDLDIENAQITAKEIEYDFQVIAKAYKVDVSNYEAVLRLKNVIEADVGFVDILVNNAGVLALMSLREGKHSDYQKIMDVNILSHFWTCRVFLGGMIKRQRGHIVAISSISAFITIPRAIAYSCSKFAVRGFMSALYDEVVIDKHDEYIRVTTVYPSFINTRKELADIVDSTGDFTPRLTPACVAEETVKGILYNKHSVMVPGIFGYLLPFLPFIPQRMLSEAKVSFYRDPDRKFMKNEEI